MKLLVVGGGGREHAIVWKLAQSPLAEKIYCAPGNGGIAGLAECVDIRASDVDGLVRFARERAIDLVVVGPDDPLALGLVDALEGAGIRAFGPRKAAARLEWSKSYSKGWLQKYGIPTAADQTFTDAAAALAYLAEREPPFVIKADGLALGKGVIIAGDRAEAEAAIRSIMVDRAFGDAGASVVIEEYLTGPEMTVLAFTDGRTIRLMPCSQDHKRAFDGDKGPNTGGMGAFAPSPVYTPEIARECEE
ncbi:MAG: phosphoribosylamine--glycine ligase, partial [Clostridiales bacterium]|nr:phosphoribosylamine--glycine ligase [Clostridiales bacterium]